MSREGYFRLGYNECEVYIVLKFRGRFYDGGGESLEYSLMVTWTRHREGGRVQENMTKIRALGERS